MLAAQDNLPAALGAYRACLAIAERLAKFDPGNATWQRVLAMSHGRVATVLGRLVAAKPARTASRGKALIVGGRQGEGNFGTRIWHTPHQAHVLPQSRAARQGRRLECRVRLAGGDRLAGCTLHSFVSWPPSLAALAGAQCAVAELVRCSFS